MSTIVTGTPERQATHSVLLAPVGLVMSMVVPVAVIVLGIVAEGPAAIAWIGAALWGVVATVVFNVISILGRAMGITRMDLLDLLGSAVAEPDSAQARAAGAMIHHINGTVLGIGGAYAAVLIGAELNWVTGAGWGLALWLLALLMMSTIGAVHPAIRRHEQDDPGPAATNFGRMTPVASLVGHLVFGVVLGLLYQAWPLG